MTPPSEMSGFDKWKMVIFHIKYSHWTQNTSTPVLNQYKTYCPIQVLKILEEKFRIGLLYEKLQPPEVQNLPNCHFLKIAHICTALIKQINSPLTITDYDN